MALKQAFASQSEVPEAFREHYAEKDGKWILQTDPPTDDVTGLKTALDKERTARRDVEKQLTDTKVRFEGIDPDDVVKLKERVKGLDDADVYDKQGIEALVTKRTQTLKDDHARVVTAKERELIQLKDTNTSLDRRWRQDRIKTALLDAAARAGVAKQALPDAVQRGMAVFVDLDEHGTVIARNGEDVRYGKDGVNPLSPDEWVLSLKPEAPHLWPPSSGGGAPPHHQGNGDATDWAKLPPTERLTKFREQQAAKR